ncbi:hypothetical protein HYH03_008080 [Edaphochlamys debaryana]|uniref:Uncharacterized protein n=1 Tax=Edaphochlamys debaryana TaxID=47281 RepID=A0A835YAA9_9CHLO|nr:hypothetical protein HYH03_008080 [Edaphochlamys debaryana]|eukprot:KAG2493864.1 hypothetical protein HYH03_008080 [Edaphochlamys debaryana]
MVAAADGSTSSQSGKRALGDDDTWSACKLQRLLPSEGTNGNPVMKPAETPLLAGPPPAITDGPQLPPSAIASPTTSQPPNAPSHDAHATMTDAPAADRSEAILEGEQALPSVDSSLPVLTAVASGAVPAAPEGAATSTQSPAAQHSHDATTALTDEPPPQSLAALLNKTLDFPSPFRGGPPTPAPEQGPTLTDFPPRRPTSPAQAQALPPSTPPTESSSQAAPPAQANQPSPPPSAGAALRRKLSPEEFRQLWAWAVPIQPIQPTCPEQEQAAAARLANIGPYLPPAPAAVPVSAVPGEDLAAELAAFLRLFYLAQLLHQQPSPQ